MRVKTSSKKKQALNLNVYRNLPHRSAHAQKKKFEELAKKLLRGIPPLGVITLHYEVCVETKRRLDVMNVGSIIDKYFSDCLTFHGIIKDDDYKHIPEVKFTFGGFVDKEHVLVTITEIEPRSTPMRVLLDDTDIQKALTAYVDGLGLSNSTGVKITTTDGELTAEVMFGTDETEPTSEENTPEEVTPPKKRGRGGRPKGSKNLPKNEDKGEENVGTPVQAGAAGSGEGDNLPSADETSATTAAERPDEPTDIVPKVTKKGNLFGDGETPSSEDDDQAEATPDHAPAPIPVTEEPAKKKGSIFDA